MPIDKFPIEYPENEDQLNNPVGGSYQQNTDLKAYYTSQSQGYGRDIEFLDEKIKEIDALNQPLISAASVQDRAVAESAVRYNEQVNIIVQTSQDAVTCGCTFTQDVGAGVAMTMTIAYDDVVADKKNLNSLGYGGDEPLNDAGDILIVDASGAETTIKDENLGDGQDITISPGLEVEYFEITNIEPFLSCGNCISLYNQQQAAFAAADDAQAESVRSTAVSKSNSIKSEREELLKERWTLTFGKEETQSRKSNVDNFLSDKNYEGA
jgi:hypothetical protein